MGTPKWYTKTLTCFFFFFLQYVCSLRNARALAWKALPCPSCRPFIKCSLSEWRYLESDKAHATLCSIYLSPEVVVREPLGGLGSELGSTDKDHYHMKSALLTLQAAILVRPPHALLPSAKQEERNPQIW